MNEQKDIQELLSVIEEQSITIQNLKDTIASSDKLHKQELAKLRRLRLTLTSEHAIDIQELKDEILYQSKRIYQLESEAVVPKRKFPRTVSTRTYTQIHSPIANGASPQNRQYEYTPVYHQTTESIKDLEMFTNLDEQHAIQGCDLFDDLMPFL